MARPPGRRPGLVNNSWLGAAECEAASRRSVRDGCGVVNTPLPPEVIDDIRRPRTPEADRTGPVIGVPHYGAA